MENIKPKVTKLNPIVSYQLGFIPVMQVWFNIQYNLKHYIEVQHVNSFKNIKFLGINLTKDVK